MCTSFLILSTLPRLRFLAAVLRHGVPTLRITSFGLLPSPLTLSSGCSWTWLIRRSALISTISTGFFLLPFSLLSRGLSIGTRLLPCAWVQRTWMCSLCLARRPRTFTARLDFCFSISTIPSGRVLPPCFRLSFLGDISRCWRKGGHQPLSKNYCSSTR